MNLLFPYLFVPSLFVDYPLVLINGVMVDCLIDSLFVDYPLFFFVSLGWVVYCIVNSFFINYPLFFFMGFGRMVNCLCPSFLVDYPLFFLMGLGRMANGFSPSFLINYPLFFFMGFGRMVNCLCPSFLNQLLLRMTLLSYLYRIIISYPIVYMSWLFRSWFFRSWLFRSWFLRSRSSVLIAVITSITRCRCLSFRNFCFRIISGILCFLNSRDSCIGLSTFTSNLYSLICNKTHQN